MLEGLQGRVVLHLSSCSRVDGSEHIQRKNPSVANKPSCSCKSYLLSTPEVMLRFLISRPSVGLDSSFSVSVPEVSQQRPQQ